MAEYAEYIANIQKAGGKKENYEKLIQFMAKHDKDGEDVARESIFRALIKSQYQDSSANTKDDLLRNKITSISSLQARIQQQSQKGLECLRLANYAPKDTRDMVQAMLQNKSKYIDYNQLAKYLAMRDYSLRFDPKMFID
jgi:sigma54-dependent transcription regulator